METYMTADEVAALFKISLGTIRRYVQTNQIPFHRVSRAVRFKRSEVEWWFDNNGVLLNEGQAEVSDGALFEEVPLETADKDGFFVPEPEPKTETDE